MSKRKAIAVAFAAAVVATLMLVPVGAGAAQTATYEITIENLNTGFQPFTPPAVATHKQSFELFSVGSQASEAVQGVAENGNVPGLIETLEGNNKVSDFKAVGAPNPIGPGGEVTFKLTATGGAKYFSFVSMLVCTNDGFTGLDSVRLPKKVGDSAEYRTDAYDAGTEYNTENMADLVPPCSGIEGVGTVMSNPDLATDGVISHHAGISGEGMGTYTLDEMTHGWDDPVAMVTITRTN